MTIKLYQTPSEKNKVVKWLDNEKSFTGTLRDTSSVINPVILIETDGIANYNYAWIDEFNRFYFIRNIESVRNGLWKVTMHVDVISTYAEYIKQNSAVIARNSNVWNLYYQDDQFKILNYETLQTKSFSGTLIPNSQFVLIVAGG